MKMGNLDRGGGSEGITGRGVEICKKMKMQRQHIRK